MKLVSFLSFFLPAIATISNAHANPTYVQKNKQVIIDSHKEGKIYVDSNKIVFDNKEIHVCLNQNWVQTNAVFADANGFYIVDEKGGWTCGFCGYYNTTSLRYCDNCDRER